MKRIVIIVAACISMCSCSILSGVNWNSDALMSAAGKVLTATSITDAQIVQLSAQSVAQMDQQNKIETLQQQVNKLQMDQALCGVVRYPNQMVYAQAGSPFCNYTGNGCANCGNI